MGFFLIWPWLDVKKLGRENKSVPGISNRWCQNTHLNYVESTRGWGFTETDLMLIKAHFRPRFFIGHIYWNPTCEMAERLPARIKNKVKAFKLSPVYDYLKADILMRHSKESVCLIFYFRTYN